MRQRLVLLLLFWGIQSHAAQAQISVLPEEIGWQELSIGWRSFGNFIPQSSLDLSDEQAFALNSNMSYVRGSYRFHPLAAAGGGLAWNGQHGSLNVFGRWYFYANETPFLDCAPIPKAIST